MAGFVTVDNDAKDGTINIGSSMLRILYSFLKLCKLSSPVLKADESFQPELDEKGVLGAANCIFIDELSDASLTELQRLLREALQPSHPFWEDTSNYSEPFIKEKLIQLGIDVDTRLNEIKSIIQADFCRVADVIQRRLEGKMEKGKGKNGLSRKQVMEAVRQKLKKLNLWPAEE